MSTTAIPRYRRIKQALLEEIQQGVFTPDRPFVTEREICGRFGVSRPTAVRVLTELAHEGVLTRRRGRGTFVAESTPAATPHRVNSVTPLVACIVNDLRGEQNIAILRGVEHVCHETGFHLLVFDSKLSPRVEALNIQRARDAGVAALIVYPVHGYANRAHFAALRRDGIPLVMVDRYYPDLPTDVVVPDNIGIGRRVTSYLIEQGHRSIAFIPSAEVSCTSVLDRLTGYRLAFLDHNVPLQPELAPLRPYAESPKSDRALLASWLAAPYRPTACVAATSGSLVCVARDLLSLGVQLPGGLALASMDDVNLDPLMTLTVAKAALPSYEMGSAAMRLALDRVIGAADQPLRHVVLPVSISTAAAGAARFPTPSDRGTSSA